MANKSKLVNKYEKAIVKEDTKESELNELDNELSEDAKESQEGLGIEEEEEAGQEPYPEIEAELEHDDNPDKEDGE
jgi:hypothetical protein